MNFEILSAPAERRLDIGDYTGDPDDYVTLRVWPMEKEAEILSARTKGMNVEFIRELSKNNPDIDMNNEKDRMKLFSENSAMVLKSSEHFDGGFGFMTLALEHGTDPKKHSIIGHNGKPKEMTRKAWEEIIKGGDGRKLCAFIVAAVEDFQREYSSKK